MRFYRGVWLIILIAGLMFVSAALVNGATDNSVTASGAPAAGWAADECDDSLDALSFDMPDVALLTGSSDDQACRDCHTNQEALQELAVEVEVEQLSEGPG